MYKLTNYVFYLHIGSSYRSFRELELERISEEKRIENEYLEKKRELELYKMGSKVNQNCNPDFSI